MNLPEKLALINELKRKADDLKPPKDWDQAFLEKVKIEFTYNSNKIEGNTITYGQTVGLLKDLVTPKGVSKFTPPVDVPKAMSHLELADEN